MLILLFLLFLCVAVVYILVNYYKTFYYWKDKGIKYVTPLPFVGNSLPTLIQSLNYSEYIEYLYNQFPNDRYCGTFQYGQPILLLRDLDLIKRLFTKEFDSFSEHALPSGNDEDTLWGKNLFAAKGEKWRHLRQIISPVFTTTKLKSMFGLMDNCAKQLMDYLNEQDEDIIEVELGDLFKRYSSDTIATIAFGIECNSFKDKNNDFIKMGTELTNFGGLQKLKRLLYSVNSNIIKLLNMQMHPKNVSNYFRKLVKDSINDRRNIKNVRPDYIQHLLQYKEDGIINDDDITAQALDFFYGGFYSTASLITFCLYELAVNPEIQSHLRDEIDQALEQHNDSRVNYNNLNRMKYMDMVILETLRKWPTAWWIDRKSTKSFVIEPESSNENSLDLETGTICWIPVFAIQRDSKYWPDPLKFDPERFNESNKKANSPAFLPFGAGPRICVGSRFAIMEAKLIIFYIISSYEVIPIEKSVLEKNPYLTSANSFWFGLRKIEKK